jgi:hypothetical protein
MVVFKIDILRVLTLPAGTVDLFKRFMPEAVDHCF